MNNFFRAIIAGYGAKKLGGGCFGTIIVFIIIWVALGQCSFSPREVPPPETFPADRRTYRIDAGLTVRPIAVDHKRDGIPLRLTMSRFILPEMRGPVDQGYVELSFYLAEPWGQRLVAQAGEQFNAPFESLQHFRPCLR